MQKQKGPHNSVKTAGVPYKLQKMKITKKTKLQRQNEKLQCPNKYFFKNDLKIIRN